MWCSSSIRWISPLFAPRKSLLSVMLQKSLGRLIAKLLALRLTLIFAILPGEFQVNFI